MADELGGAAGSEIGQNRDHYSFIGVYRKEEDAPTGRVFGADGYLVSGLDAGRLEKDMVALYDLSKLGICVNCSFVVT